MQQMEKASTWPKNLVSDATLFVSKGLNISDHSFIRFQNWRGEFSVSLTNVDGCIPMGRHFWAGVIIPHTLPPSYVRRVWGSDYTEKAESVTLPI